MQGVDRDIIEAIENVEPFPITKGCIFFNYDVVSIREYIIKILTPK